jgi:3-oxoacyl-[acyl-carrier protein] reductase
MSPRRALVTGGSGALGAAICRRLAEDGLHVIVHANSRLERAREIAGTLTAAGGSAEAVAFDVTDEAAVGAAIEALLEAGPVQVAVNNAGVHDDAPMAGMSAAQWRSVVDVSLNGFFLVTRPLLLPMMRARWGRIVNVSSVSGIMGNRGQTNYAAAKAGLHGATKSLALECASRGVTVNAVAPGVIDTPETGEAFPPERIDALVPMKRAGTPEEVADLVGFLASDRAGYITGQVIAIGGGLG